MSNLKRLLARCQAGVFLTVNEHRGYYMSVEEALSELESSERPPDDVVSVMASTDTIVDLQFYPDTPIGFYRIWHYDADVAIAKALSILGEDA